VTALIDISPALRVGMGAFPGDAAFAVNQTFTIGPDCPVNVASIAMSTHCGAHVDAPLHYDADGASIDMLEQISSARRGWSRRAGAAHCAVLTRSRPLSTARRRGCCSN